MLAARAKRAIRNPTSWFFIWLFSMSVLWSFAQPLFGSPDETAHVAKATATADLQFSGQTTIGDFGFESKVFEVPQAYSLTRFALHLLHPRARSTISSLLG